MSASGNNDGQTWTASQYGNDPSAVGFDTDGDGAVEEIQFDNNGDGIVDEVRIDNNGDGIFDEVLVDTDGDGYFDYSNLPQSETIAAPAVTDVSESDSGSDSSSPGVYGAWGSDGASSFYDANGDGYAEAAGYDTDGDGAVDVVTYDTDGDGIQDTAAYDFNGDGMPDAYEHDYNADGVVDDTTIA